jgi:hypothetical protein
MLSTGEGGMALTQRWLVKVGIYRNNQDFRDDRPLRVMDVSVEHEHEHSAMSLAEMRTKEILNDDSLQVYAIGTTTVESQGEV